MKTLLLLSLIFLTQFASGQNALLKQYRWENRLVLLFGSISESQVEKQIAELEKDTAGMADRDLLIFYIEGEKVRFQQKSSTSALSGNRLRSRYNIPEDEFRYILIGKDGGVKLNNKDFVSNEDLFSVIDAMPMRQREMRNSK